MQNDSYWSKKVSRVLFGYSLVVGSVTTAFAGVPTQTQISTFIQSLSAAGPTACPAAYTQNPDVPTVMYSGQDRLRSSQLIANVASSDILSDQKTKTGPFQGFPLPNGQTLGTYTPPNQGVDLYRVNYLSTDLKGQPTELSGLVVFPQGGMDGGLIVYDHATQISQTGGAPSFPSGEACIVITAMGGKGRVIAMPDYLGFGISSDAHPYPLGIQNAPASIDLITATRELAAALYPGKPIGSPLYITGYSEGGGNALMLGRLLEQKKLPNLKPSLLAPMSGNYDMTGAMAQSLIVTQPGQQATTLVSKPLLALFAAQGAWDVTGSDPNSLVQPSFASYGLANSLPLPWNGQAEQAAYITGLMITSYNLGYLKGGASNPSVLLQPQLVSAIQTRDLSNPVIALWAQNDDTVWNPETPIYATGILQDQIVPFAGSSYPPPPNYTGGNAFFAQGNTENLILSMRSRGYKSSAVSWCGLDAENFINSSGKKAMLNHLNGLVPVSILAARAIEQGTLTGLPVLPDP